jgi:hypothetical protein
MANFANIKFYDIDLGIKYDFRMVYRGGKKVGPELVIDDILVGGKSIISIVDPDLIIDIEDIILKQIEDNQITKEVSNG